jgi:glycolate oxidase
MCVELGGSITGEHGIGVEKRDYMPEMFSSIDLEIMRAICTAIDPRGLSNPGKMFPSGEAQGSGTAGLHAHSPHPLEVAGVISRE